MNLWGTASLLVRLGKGSDWHLGGRTCVVRVGTSKMLISFDVAPKGRMCLLELRNHTDTLLVLLDCSWCLFFEFVSVMKSLSD